MNIAERQKCFEEAVFGDPLFDRDSWHVSSMFGISSSAMFVEGGLLIGNSALDSYRNDRKGIVFISVVRFPPEDEVYFAVYIHSDIETFKQRLSNMPVLAREGNNSYSEKNNNVKPYLAQNGRIYLVNKVPANNWNTLNYDLSILDPSIKVDKIVCAVYPPSASAHRSLMAREFIGYLARFVGRESVIEVQVWDETLTIGPNMRRMPSTINIKEIEKSIEILGGYYTDNLVERFHIASNYLEAKHFVILTGISGTGKTSLVKKYAQAVHGITDQNENDPLLFMCPVRPDWTDPSGLLGYYDVITNRYVVPTFLESILVAIAHSQSPVFVCLDEMNLARVEYYFSEVLSAMESGSKLNLHSNSIPLQGSTGGEIPDKVPLPSNLYLIGTVNIDETTQPFSDKVLDRAIVIDMSSIDLDGFLTSLAIRFPELEKSIEECRGILTFIHEAMLPHGMGLGYRTIEEFVRYFNYAVNYGTSSAEDIIDRMLAEKVLIKLRGTEKQRSLLSQLNTRFKKDSKCYNLITKLIDELNELGSFQTLR